MASVEHCLYCFESLAASLEGRQPMSLYQVMNSWAEYPKGLDSDNEEEGSVGEENGGDGEEVEGDTVAQASASTSTSSEQRRSDAFTRTDQRLARPSSSQLRSNKPKEKEGSGYSTPEPERPFTPVGIGKRSSQRNTTITESPLFVTWNKSNNRNGTYNLRGCIGTFEAQPLSSGLSSYAITSAIHDTRFNPITLAELSSLEVAVTLLTDFETCSDPMDWKLGIHGLRVSFYYRNRRYGATYLPDVAVEQGWDKEETLVSLMKKAGWTGKGDRWREVGELKVIRYQGKKESVEYEEYKAWRTWVEKGVEKS